MNTKKIIETQRYVSRVYVNQALIYKKKVNSPNYPLYAIIPYLWCNRSDSSSQSLLYYCASFGKHTITIPHSCSVCLITVATGKRCMSSSKILQRVSCSIFHLALLLFNRLWLDVPLQWPQGLSPRQCTLQGGQIDFAYTLADPHAKHFAARRGGGALSPRLCAWRQSEVKILS